MNETAQKPLANPGGPSVTIFQEMNKPTGLKKILSFFRSPALIFIILIGIILVEIVVAVRTITTPIPKVSKVQPISSGKIVVFSAKSAYKVGENVPVDVLVSTGGHPTDGTDLILKYDSSALDASSANFFEKGDTYAEYPLVNVDPKNGLISVSGVSSQGKSSFNGSGKLARLNFKPLKLGKTSIEVESKPGSTTDSNIIESMSSNDLLGQTFNLDLSVESNPVSQVKASQAVSCDGFIQTCQDDKGRQGLQNCTRGSLKSDACVWDPYLTVNCSDCTLGK